MRHSKARTMVQLIADAEKLASSQTIAKPLVSRRLSTEQEEARLTIYEEAAQHLEMSVCDNDCEIEAAKIIAKQIRALAIKFERSRNSSQRYRAL